MRPSCRRGFCTNVGQTCRSIDRIGEQSLCPTEFHILFVPVQLQGHRGSDFVTKIAYIYAAGSGSNAKPVRTVAQCTQPNLAADGKCQLSTKRQPSGRQRSKRQSFFLFRCPINTKRKVRNRSRKFIEKPNHPPSQSDRMPSPRGRSSAPSDGTGRSGPFGPEPG